MFDILLEIKTVTIKYRHSWQQVFFRSSNQLIKLINLVNWDKR